MNTPRFKQGVEDDHMNVLCLGGRSVGRAVAWDIARAFWQPNTVALKNTCAAFAKRPCWK